MAIKRVQEQIKEKIKEYGINRARYKEYVNNKYELKNIIKNYVRRNELSSPLLHKYKSKNFTENLDNKNNENNENNNTNSDINNKKKNLNVNISLSNNSSPSKFITPLNYLSPLKNDKTEEIELNLPSKKKIIKYESYKNIRKLDKKSGRKISFSLALSQ